MRRLACIAVIVGSILPAAQSRAAPRGRVVRVDRVRSPAAIPSMCMMMMEDRMLCIGKPAVEEVVHLFESERGKAIGQLRIDSVRDFQGFRLCPGKPPIIFEVTGTVTVGSSDLLDGSHRVVGLRHADLDDTSRLLKNVRPPSAPDPSQTTTRQVELAVDFDGDSAPDYVLEHYTCPPESGASSRTPATCFDTYLERRGKLELVRRDSIHICT